MDDVKSFQESLTRVSRALNYLTRVHLGKRGLGLSGYLVLLYLMTERETHMSKLQKYMLLSSATMTGLVDGLVNEGLVRRSREGEDRRMVYLRLTGPGEALAKEVEDYRCSCLREALADPSADLETTTRLLNGLLDGLKEQIASPSKPCSGKMPGGADDDSG